MHRIAVALLAAAFLPLTACRSASRPDLAARVREETRFAWNAYEKYAWGHDELKPLTKAGHDWHNGQSLLMTPVDTLDTLLMMGLHDEAEKAKTLIVETLSFDKDISVKNFEITIRILGGLLSAYQMTGDERLLTLADDLGTRLLPVFETLKYFYLLFAPEETLNLDTIVFNTEAHPLRKVP